MLCLLECIDENAWQTSFDQSGACWVGHSWKPGLHGSHSAPTNANAPFLWQLLRGRDKLHSGSAPGVCTSELFASWNVTGFEKRFLKVFKKSWNKEKNQEDLQVLEEWASLDQFENKVDIWMERRINQYSVELNDVWVMYVLNYTNLCDTSSNFEKYVFNIL